MPTDSAATVTYPCCQHCPRSRPDGHEHPCRKCEPTRITTYCDGDECTASLPFDSGEAVGWTVWETGVGCAILCPDCTTFYRSQR